MERADIAKLWALEEIAAAGHGELAANLRTAINELEILRAGRTVSCEACNAMAKRVAVLEEECEWTRKALFTVQCEPLHHHPRQYHDGGTEDCPVVLRIVRARLSTDSARAAMEGAPKT